MKEKMTYEEMILLLQSNTHQAKEGWSELTEELDLEDNLALLPAHKLEEDIWEGIAAELPAVEAERKSRLLTINTLLRYAAIGLFLLLSGTYFYNQINKDPYTYHSEIEAGKLPSLNLPQHDEAAIAKAKAFINENSFLFTEELINEFQNELGQLEADISAIKSLQDTYGIEETEIKMISKLERQKAAIIKSMLNRQ